MGHAAAVPPSLPTLPKIQFSDWQEVPRVDGGREFDLQFPSAVKTAYPENDLVPLKFLFPDEGSGPLPVVLVLHYWGATDLRAERALGARLNRKGIVCAIMTLPFHLERTPAGHRSGDLAIPPKIADLKANTIQAVQDVRRSIDFISTRKEFHQDRIGIAGTSLGALISGLAYAVDPRIFDASFLLGGVDWAHILWESSLVVRQREVLRHAGYDEEKLRNELVDIEPLSYLPRPHSNPAFIVGGKFDTVIPISCTQALINAMPGSQVLWLDTGHYGGIFVQGKLLSLVADYFGRVFDNQPFVAPARIIAPTIRLGFQANSLNGLDVGAGVDLYRFDSQGKGFANLFLTPRGLQMIIARQIDQQFAVGVIGSLRGVGVGAFWSTVL